MNMKVKKILTIVLSALIFAGTAFASGNYSDKSPSSKEKRDDDKAVVIIKANVSADVYIDGRHVGTTDLTTSLKPGYHNIEVSKNGYEPVKYRIQARAHYTYSYYFSLEKIYGYIKINNRPSGCTVLVDGKTVSDEVVKIEPGTYTVKVRKFGYEDFVRSVTVYGYKTTEISVSLTPAEFEINSFDVSRTVINPNSKGGIGKSTVKFYVTNHGTAVLSICDRYNNVVYHYSYDDFNTWEQSFVWRGTGYEDEKLPDGVYTIVLDSVEGFHFEQNVTIDTSLVYPLLSYTLAGSGVGTLPFGFVSDVNFVMPFIQCGVSYNYVENLDFAGVPLTTGILFDFAKNFEIGFSCNWNIGYMEGQTPFGFNFNFKGTIKSPVDSNAAICFTPNIHYGYNSMPESVPLSYDTGAGLGLGLSADYDSQNLFAGASFNYVFDTTHEKNMRNNIIKYGAALGYKFSTGSKISAWGAIHNSEVYEAGVELVSMPGSSACCIDTKIWAIKQNENKSSVCAQIGLSYLF